METKSEEHVREKDPSLTTTPALEKDPNLTTTLVSEKDSFLTTPASENDPSLTINQALEKDQSLTTSPMSVKDSSLITQAFERDSVLTTQTSENDSFFSATQASKTDPSLTTIQASENDPSLKNQGSHIDPSLTTPASEKDLSSTTTQSSHKDSSLVTTRVSEKDLSSTTTQASEEDRSLITTQASEKDPSSTATQMLANDPSSKTTQALGKDPSSTTTQTLGKNQSLAATQALDEAPSSTTTQAVDKDPSSTTKASEKDSFFTTTQTSENDPSLTNQASHKDLSLTTTPASEKDLSLTTTQALEEDPSLTTTQMLANDPSSKTTQALGKDPSSTTTQILGKDRSLTATLALDKDPSSITTQDPSSATTHTLGKDPSLTATQALDKDPSSTATQASQNYPSLTIAQATKKDSSSTTKASEKDPSLTSQASKKDPSLTTSQASENDLSSTTKASEKDPSSAATQVLQKDPPPIKTQASLSTTQVLENGTSLTIEKIPEKTILKVERMPSDVSSLSPPPSGAGHRRTKSDVSPGSGNRRSIGFQKWKSQVQRALKWGKDESKDYNFNPEILADQKRQWYQLHSNSTGLTYKEPTSLFEHFIIAGLHPNSNLEAVEAAYARQKKWEMLNGNKMSPDPKKMRHLEPPSLEPEILFEYPPGKRLSMSPKDLAAFCFPDSVKARVLERTPSLSELNEIFFGQEHLSTDDLSFVFSLKVADNATLYGVCLLVKEIVQRPPTPSTMLGDSMPQPPSYEGSSRVLTSAPRCYCVLTRAPFFELHYEVLKSIITQERLTRVTQFVNYVSLHDHAPAVSRSNDHKKENADPPKQESSADWMATAIPIDSAVALTAAAAGIITDDEIFSTSSKGEHRSSESTSTETSEQSHVQEVVIESGKNLKSLDDHTSEAPETLRDGLDVEQKLEVVESANPRIYAMDHPASSESLISSVSSMDEDEKLSCSNDKASKEDWIVEWAKENNNALLQIVCSYYSMPFPERGGEISFKPLEHLQTVAYERPSVTFLTQTEKHLNLIRWDTLSDMEGDKKLAAAEEAAALSIWTTAAICRALSLENILTLLTGVLLEKQVLFVYPNLGVLSAMVLSIIPIIRPFQWQSLFLPVLPGKMKDFLDAPVPFIVGMQHMPTDFKLKTSNLIHVDVEKDQVKSCKLPVLPDYKDLISELGPIYFKMSKHYAIAKKRPVYNYNETEAEAAGRFLAVMRRYLYSLCTDLRSHTITSVRANNDRVSILLKDSFLDSFPSKDQSFVKLFLDTQLFSVLSDSYLSNYEN